MVAISNLPQIPEPSGSIDPSVKRTLDALRLTVNNLTNPTSATRAPTVAELVAAGILTANGPASTLKKGAATDYTIPSAVTNLKATGAFGAIILSWDQTPATVAYVEVLRSTTDTVGTGVKVGQTSLATFADTPPSSSTAVTYYYWVRGISTGGAAGPWNAITGSAATTSNDPTYALQVLTGKIGTSSLTGALKTTINDNTTGISTEKAIRVANIAPDWVAGTAYVVGDHVVYNNDVYKCTTANSDAAWTPANWTLESSLYTSIGNLTTQNNQTASAELANAVSISNNTGSINVEQAIRAQVLARDWVGGNPYAVGDRAMYNNVVYRCLTANSDVAFNAANWVAASNLYAQYTLKIDVNNKIVGFGIASDGPGNASDNFEVVADKFAVIRPNTPWAANNPYALWDVVNPSVATGFLYQATTVTGNSGAVEPVWPTVLASTVVDGGITWTAIAIASQVPFTVDTQTGAVYIDAAFIQDATITNAKIANLAVDSLKLADGSVINAKIGSAAVTDANINDVSAGKLTAGTIAVAIELTSPIVRFGQTGFNTGTGFFIGYNGTTPQFSLGDPAGSSITFDGATLAINADIVPQYSPGTIQYAKSANAYSTGAVGSSNWVTSTQKYSSWVQCQEILVPGEGTMDFSVPVTCHFTPGSTGSAGSESSTVDAGAVIAQLQFYVDGVAKGTIYSFTQPSRLSWLGSGGQSESHTFTGQLTVPAGATVSAYIRAGDSGNSWNYVTANSLAFDVSRYYASQVIR